MKLSIEGTSVYEQNFDAQSQEYRIIVNQGGRGSSKTWSIAQLLLGIAFSKNNIIITVCRKTLPALKTSAMKDMLTIMKEWGVYRDELFNKSELIYRIPSRNNEIEFISVDEPMKIRGRKRQYLWLNEVLEFTYEDFRQLNMRTERQIFMDYNPSDEYHWVYDKILTRKDCKFIQSTYLDNPFLEKAIVQEIERLKGVDKNYWKIYGLGERATSEGKIYTHWQFCDEVPKNPESIVYGLDFGYNNPTALIKIYIKDRDVYWEEILYQSFLKNFQLIEKLKELKITPYEEIYPDPSEPAFIDEIKQAGFNIGETNKDVRKGIDTIQSHKLFITKSSVNVLKEIKSYRWKTKDEKVLDEPVKDNDHLMDAGRYGTHSYFVNLGQEPKVEFI